MLSSLNTTYKDYVIEQLCISRNEEISNYWREELLDYKKFAFPDPPALTLDEMPNTSVNSLSPLLYASLKKAAKQQRVSIKSLCLAAFISTLYMHSYEEDILIGLVENGRPLSNDGARILGCFLNTVPMRTVFESAMRWGDLTQAVNRKQTDLKRYGRMSLVQILKAIGEQSNRANPLFDVAFNFIDFHVYESVEQGLFEFMPYSFERTNTMLDFSVSVTLGQLSVKMVSSYEKDFTDRLLEVYVRVLHLIADKPEHAIDKAEVMTAEEAELLRSFNDTFAEYPSAATIASLFDLQVMKRPNAPALVSSQCELTYQELDRRVNIFAFELMELGITSGQHVGLIADRSFDMIVAILAILKLGCAYVPLDPEFPADRMRDMLADSGARWLITTKGLSVTGYEGKVVSLSLYEQPIREEMEEGQATSHSSLQVCQAFYPSPDDIAYVMYTSGSTGKPKGVMTTHRNIIKTVINNGFVEISEADRMLQLSNYAFDGSTYEIFGALLNGATLVLIAKKDMLNVSELTKTLERQRITSAFMTAALFNMVVEWDISSLKHVRRLFFGGEAASMKHVLKALDYLGENRIANGYGPTETTVFAATYLVNESVRKYSSVPIGRPIHNTRAYVLSQRGHLQPIGVPGELYIAGEGLSQGYLGMPELTKERYVRHPVEQNGRMYRTGDLVRWLPNGNLEYFGRIDQQVKIRGNRIELGEIEGRLLEISSIQEAVVIVAQDEQQHSYLCAYIVPAQSCILPPISEWKKALRQSLPEYMVPSAFVTLTSFPLTLNGKLDRKALPQPTQVQDINYKAPSNTTEEMLVRLWEDILDIQSVGTEHHFFEIGGNSLKSMLLVAKIQKETGVKLSLQDVFTMPTIRELASGMMKLQPQEYEARIVPAPIQETYPASSIQKRMYIVQHFENAGTNYNMPLMFELHGKLDEVRLQTAIRSLIQRHEALRSSFEMVDGELRQRVYDMNSLPLFSYQRENVTDVQDEGAALNAYAKSFIKPFQLGEAPLIRAGLLTFAEERHTLFIDVHHIVSDGTSTQILFNELISLYQEHELPPLRIQYKDYAVWEQQHGREDVEKNETYWLAQFEQMVPILELPTDFPRSAVRSFTGSRSMVSMDASLVAKLISTAAKRHETVFMIMMAAYQVLLSKYTGEEEIVVGTPFTCRGLLQDDPIVGMFANTLALRGKPLAGLTVSEYLDDVRKRTLSAYEHGTYPLQELLNHLSRPFDSSRQPLFDTMFVVQEAGTDRVHLPELQVSYTEWDHGTSKFDLTWVCTLSAGNMQIAVEYRNDLWKPESIQRMIEHYHHVLTQIVEAPHLLLGALELTTEAELRQLNAWNDTEANYPRDSSVVQLFEHQARLNGEADAVIMDGSKLTYQGLDESANRFARYLVRKGVVAGASVGILMDRSIEMIVAIFGVIKAGGVYVPLDPSFPEERLIFMLGNSEAKWLITSEKHYLHGYDGEVIQFAERLWTDESAYHLEPSTDGMIKRPTPEDPIYIMYTSGSTGLPKGVVTTHRNVVKTSMNNGFMEVRSTDRMLQLSNYAFDGSTYEIFGALLNGAALVLIRKEDLLSTTELANVFEEQRITSAFMTAALFNTLVDWDVTCLKHVSKLFFGGEAGSKKHVIKALDYLGPNRIANGYGPTETTVFAATYSVDESIRAQSSVPIGRPINNTRVYVLNRWGQRQPVGIPGELFIGGEGVARAYLGQAELSSEKFLQDPYCPSEQMYRTGDLVRWLPDGNLEFIERLDHQVKIRGNRIEISEVEAQLQQLPDIKKAVVIADKDNQGYSYLFAYIVPNSNEISSNRSDEASELISQWKKELRGKLPDYMVPTIFLLLETIPLTSNGKVDRRALPKPTPQRKDQHAPATNVTEERLIQIWEDVLEITRIGIHDHFFELGGHSLTAMLLLGKVHQTFNVKLTFQDVFNKPTLEEMADWIQRAGHQVYQAIKVAPVQDTYPVTSIQKQIYYTQQLDSNNTSYNMPILFELSGSLDVERIEAAFNQIIAAHEALRTSFHMESGELVQRVQTLENVRWEMTSQDVSSIDDSTFTTPPHLAAAKDNVDFLSSWMDNFVRPFDLTQAPLLRVGLLKISSSQSFLVVDIHHIVFDGVSMSLLYDELIRLYDGASLVPNPIQFKDYSVWEQQQREHTNYAAHEAYWLGQFADFNSAAELPFDRSRPAIRNDVGKTYKLTLHEKRVEQLKQMAAAHDVTLFMLLLSIYGSLISKYTGEEQVIIGTPVAGRDHADIQSTMGMFVNTLALRLAPKAGLQVHEYMADIKAYMLSAYEHGSYPLSELVEKLHIPFDASRNPLFDTLFVLQDMSLTARTIQEITFSPRTWQGRQAKFDMTWAWHEEETQLVAEIEYRTDLWNEDTIERMAGHFEQLIDQFVRDAETRLCDIELLSSKERNLLAAWNDTSADYPREQTVSARFEEKAMEQPEHPAVCFGDQTLSYGELNERANHLASLLISKGIQRGEFVGLLTQPSLEMIVAILAILKAGGAYVPLDPSFPEERLAFVLKDSNAKLLLAEKGHAIPTYAGSVMILGEPHLYDAAVKMPTQLSALASDPAYIMYTSGSTGTPKGVVITHQNVIKTSVNNGFMEIKPADRMLQLSNYAFDGSTYEIFGALLNGATLVLIRKVDLQNVVELARMFEEQRITSAFMTAALFNTLVDWDVTCLKHVSKLFFGGEAGSKKHVVKALDYLGPDRIANGYGPTETTVFAATYSVDESIREKGTVPIGRPINNTRVYVLNRWGQQQPVGVPGELHIGGEGLAHAYLNQPGLTAERFIEHPFHAGERLYRTGDLVRWMADGNLEYLGRMDQQVKIRGNRIELTEVEDAIRSLPSVSEAIVVERRDEQGHSMLGAYVVPNVLHSKEMHITRDEELITEWRKALKKRLPEYMIPSVFVVMPSIPLTRNGKVDRNSLPELGHTVSSTYIAPSTPVERELASLWKDLLNVKEVGVNDHFFELGGHSLKAMMLVANIHERWGVKITLPDLFNTSKLQEMARLIEESSVQTYAAIPRVQEQDTYPVSSAQKRLYLIEQFEETKTSYNMPMLLKCIGKLDEERLRLAFVDLIHRHESLRTSFLMVDGEIRQRVHSMHDVDWQLERVSPLCMPLADQTLHEADQDETVQAYFDYFVRPFNLNEAPLIRAGLYSISESEYLLMIDIHHIVSDGVTTGILVEELFKRYQGEQLEPLRIQYKDYAVWQHAEATKRTSESYWHEKFMTERPVLNVLTEGRRPSIRRFDGETYSFALDQQLGRTLKMVAARSDATLFMVLLSAYNVLLSKYTGEKDIVIGMPIAGRNHIETTSVVGMFVNTLALRHKLQGDIQVQEWIREVRNETLQAYEHGDYSLDELIEKLRIPRDPSRNPLFDTMFVLQDAKSVSIQLPHLDIEPISWQNKSAKFDMTWVVDEAEDALRITIEYSTDLYEASQMQRMAKHYEHVLQQMALHPEMSLNEIELITEEERHEILFQFNDTDADYPRDATIDQLFDQQVLHRPHHPAIQFAGQTITYEELTQRANHMARRLRKIGVQRGEPVGLLADRSVEMIIAIMGILKAGGAYVPIDPSFPRERIVFILDHCEARILVSSSQMEFPTFNGIHVPLQEVTHSDPSEQPEHYDQSDNEAVLRRSFETLTLDAAECPAYIMYTSGSTGTPKGVVTSHRNVVKTSINNGFMELGEQDRVLQLSNYAFDGSTYEIFGALLNGATLVLIAKDDVLSVTELAKSLEESRITSAFMTSMLFNALVDYDVTCLRHVRRLFIGGEAVSKAHALKAVDYLGERRIANGYGPTETTVFATTYNVEKDLKSFNSVPIGRPIHNTKTYVLDEEGHLLPVGISGELFIAGEGLAKQYLNQLALTEEKFISDPFLTGERMYRTGDKVRWLPNGNLEFVERIDQQVKIRGYRIEPVEIEERLTSHPTVQQAAVIARKGEGSSYLCAYIVVQGPLNVQELRKHIQETLPDYMVPSYFVPMTELPLTRNGKLDRLALPEPDVHLAQETYIAPTTENERILAQVWSEVLGLERIGIDDNYFLLGGDSIKSIQIVSKLAQHQRKLQVKHLMLYPTVGECAQYMEHMSHKKERQRVVAGELPLTPIQRWFFDQAFEVAHHWNQSMMVYNEQGWDPAIVNEAFTKLVEHHDALRMRFIQDGEWIRQVNLSVEESEHFTLEIFEVGDAEQASAHIEQVATELQARIVLDGALVKLGLFKTHQGDHLLMAIHHLVVDGVSWRILLEDFQNVYQSILTGDRPVLPDKTDSYLAWSHELVHFAKHEQLAREIPYWERVNEQASKLSFKGKRPCTIEQSNTVSIQIEQSVTRKLLTEVHRAYHTDISDLLLTALALTYAERDKEGVVVHLEGHGREDIIEHIDITRTVGWFTSMFPVVLPTHIQHLGEALRSIKEMIRSIPNKGIGFGILKHLAGMSEHAHELDHWHPEVVFNYLGQFDDSPTTGQPSTSTMPMGHLISPINQMTHLEEWNSVVSEGQFQLTFRYDPYALDSDAAHHMVERYSYYLHELIEHCLTQQSEQFTPSDFGDSDLTLDELDEISDMISKL
ncbi:non-ribosomal peptide synthetase [Paenibacillus sp. 481]|uniref:non-ribosomal peptide synthetase n=1 Tax=Paenibacillus sp. 481 TaxID=2835869 RepID=UPI001E372093|nr:non-ribosomal peptide synthetase [Paenibacillus sp. 481]UHA73333.1 amino acid adenylation domain-containing protein [Paenibacillus sp. 481]